MAPHTEKRKVHTSFSSVRSYSCIYLHSDTYKKVKLMQHKTTENTQYIETFRGIERVLSEQSRRGRGALQYVTNYVFLLPVWGRKCVGSASSVARSSSSLSGVLITCLERRIYPHVEMCIILVLWRILSL